MNLYSCFVQPKEFIIHVDDATIIGRKRHIERNNIQVITQFIQIWPFLFEIKTVCINSRFKGRFLISLLIVDINS